MLRAPDCRNVGDVNHGKNGPNMLHSIWLKAASYQDNAEQVQCCSSSDMLDVLFEYDFLFLASNLTSCKSSIVASIRRHHLWNYMSQEAEAPEAQASSRETQSGWLCKFQLV